MATEAGIRGSSPHVPLAIGTDGVAVSSRHHSFTRFATLFLVACLLTGGSLWARTDRKHFQEVTELAGVRLGMTPQDVVAALGQPNLVDTSRAHVPAAGKRKRDSAVGYVYSKSYDPDYSLQIVFFDRQAPRLGIVCEVHSYSSALGLTWGAKERAVLHKLGSPDWISLSADRKQKIISYRRWNVAYFIEKRRVIGVCISSEGAVTFVDSA